MSIADWGLTTEVNSGVEGFPSVPVFRLLAEDIERLQDVLATVESGSEEWDTFLDAFEESTEGWERALEDMKASFIEQRFFHLEPKIEEVWLRAERLFTAPESESFDQAQLQRLGENLLETVSALHWAHLATGAGGSSNPVNVFRQLALYGEEAALHSEMWAEALEKCRLFYGGALEEVQRSQQSGEASVRRRHDALTAVLNALDSLEESPEQWEDTLSSLSTAFTDLIESVSAYTDERRSGPTDFPWVNQAYHAAKRLQGEKPDDELAATALALLKERLENEQVDWRLSQGDPSQKVTPELLERREKILERLEKTVTDLQSCVDDNSLQGLSPSLDELIARSAELAAVDKDVEAFRKDNDGLACPFCGKRNPPQTKVCTACQAAIPQQFQEFTGADSLIQLGEGGLENQVVVTQGLQDLAQACLDLQAKKLEADEFVEIVETHLDETIEAMERCGEVEMPAIPAGLDEEEQEYSEKVERFGNDSLEALESGLEMCRQALELLLTTADTADVLEQRRSLQLYSQGCHTIWYSRQAAEAAYS